MFRNRVFGFVGFLLVVVGVVLLLNYFSGLTGFVIFGDVKKEVSGIAGLVFVLVGIVMLIKGLERKAEKVRRQIDQTLRSGRIGSYRETERMAKTIGYQLKKGGDHITVYDGKHHFVTAIPRHANAVATGTYRSILKDLRDHADAA